MHLNDEDNLQILWKKYSKPDCKDNLHFEYQLPDEFRVDVVLKNFVNQSRFQVQ
jgi:hypothetical protein